MSRLLITGADGFVGRRLVPAALAEGHDVVAAIAPGGTPPVQWLAPALAARVTTVTADLRDAKQVTSLAHHDADAVVHLAAVASGADARRDPTLAWQVNAAGTAALAEALAADAGTTRLLLVSTGEVYGRGHDGPIPETAAVEPCSPYAATKVGAEVAAMEVWRRTGLQVIVARPFTHTGPGQLARYVLPAFVARLRAAAASGDASVPVGDLTPVRDILDVRDVIRAYLLLLTHGEAGVVYNVATGTGRSLADCFAALSRLIGSSATPVADATLLRRADIPRLVGDPARLHAGTGWSPQIAFEQTLQDLVNAQAH